MSGGKSGGTSTSIPALSPQQNAMIAAQTGLFTSQIAPSYATAVKGATDLYNLSAGGVTNAGQNYAGIANQAQNVLGSTGESALTTGINALQNLTSPAYQKAQMEAALAPAQAQYLQNQQNLATQFGASGELGSARNALAAQQLAGANQMNQAQLAAQINQGIAGQQLQAGQTLASLGQGGLGQALTAAGQGVTAAMTPQQLYNQYASVIFGTPAAAYSPDFRGTQSSTVNRSNYGLQLSNPFANY